MSLEQMSVADERTGANLSIEQIGARLGLDSSESFRIARLLEDSGWIALTKPNEQYARLTIKGHEELAKLRRPKWQQWVERHPILVSAFWMTVTAVTAGIMYTVITYFMLKGR